MYIEIWGGGVGNLLGTNFNLGIVQLSQEAWWLLGLYSGKALLDARFLPCSCFQTPTVTLSWRQIDLPSDSEQLFPVYINNEPG